MDLHFAYVLLSLVLLAFTLAANKRTAECSQVRVLDIIFRPSQIMILYNLVFYCGGAIFFWISNILSERYMFEALSWSWMALIVWTAATVVAIALTNGGAKVSSALKQGRRLPNAFTVIFGLLGFSLAVGHALSGAYPLIIMSFSFFLWAYGNCESPPKWLIALSLAALEVCLSSAPFSKRNVIFPVIIMLMLLFQREIISRKTFSIIGAVALFAIIPTSVMRGYGGYGVETFWDSIKYSGEYMVSPMFFKYVSSNIEFASNYFHGVNSVEIFGSDAESLFGYTILRAFLSPFIYVNLMVGVDSSIEVYTFLYDPNFRSIGGSYPVNIFAEFFMNFGIISIMIYGLLLKSIDFFYKFISNHRYKFVGFAFKGALIFCALLLTRGSGFGLFLFNLIIVSILIVIALIIFPSMSGVRVRMVGSAQ